jgi:hypothetical protein
MIESLTGKRIKHKNMKDVSFIVKSITSVDEKLSLDVLWMNDLYEFEIAKDVIIINPETLNEWSIV